MGDAYLEYLETREGVVSAQQPVSVSASRS